jgi:hypothetical protein
MDHGFFTDPRFLGLLRFWEAQRGEAPVPTWRDGMAAGFPAEIAPWMIAARFDGQVGRYFYVGAECVRRFGLDPVGKRTDEFLGGAMLRYVVDLGRAAQAHGAPVFSYCLYQMAGEAPLRTARVFAPLAPDVVLTLQLYDASPAPVTRYSPRGTFEEVARKRILPGAEALRKLEQAARFQRLGKAVHVTKVADELVAAARAFDAEATVPLPVLRDADKDESEGPR